MESVEQTLDQRGKRYGEFLGHAEITQALKLVMTGTSTRLSIDKQVELRAKWDQLPVDVRECLEMIQHKIGRILNGDPLYADNFRDIAGYATLVTARLERDFPEHQ